MISDHIEFAWNDSMLSYLIILLNEKAKFIHSKVKLIPIQNLHQNLVKIHRAFCNIEYQTMKMLIDKNCLDLQRFILYLVMVQNYNENIDFYIIYTTQGCYLTYNTISFMLSILE